MSNLSPRRLVFYGYDHLAPRIQRKKKEVEDEVEVEAEAEDIPEIELEGVVDPGTIKNNKEIEELDFKDVVSSLEIIERDLRSPSTPEGKISALREILQRKTLLVQQLARQLDGYLARSSARADAGTFV